jgi:hypothetical protein
MHEQCLEEVSREKLRFHSDGYEDLARNICLFLTGNKELYPRRYNCLDYYLYLKTLKLNSMV